MYPIKRSTGLVYPMRCILLAILLGAILSVILLEVGLRLCVTPRVVTLPHPTYLHARIPNSEGLWTSPKGEFSQVIHFNSLGLRGVEPKVDRKHRLLILGDSMIEALQVPEEETLCSLLQEGLGTECLVVNAGVGGYSPLLMRLRLPELLEQIQPQMVIAGIFPNDLEEEFHYWHMATLDENGYPLAVACTAFTTWPGRLDVALFRVSTMWKFLHSPKPLITPEALSGNKGEPSAGIIYPFRDDWTEPEEEAWREISRSIAEMWRLCDSHGAAFRLLLIPPGNQVSPDAWKTGKQVMGFGPEEWVTTTTFQEEAINRTRRIGIAATDLLPPFREHPTPATLYFDTDGHWTPAGHQLAAQVLLRDASIEWWAP